MISSQIISKERLITQILETEFIWFLLHVLVLIIEILPNAFFKICIWKYMVWHKKDISQHYKDLTWKYGTKMYCKSLCISNRKVYRYILGRFHLLTVWKYNSLFFSIAEEQASSSDSSWKVTISKCNCRCFKVHIPKTAHGYEMKSETVLPCFVTYISVDNRWQYGSCNIFFHCISFFQFINLGPLKTLKFFVSVLVAHLPIL